MRFQNIVSRTLGLTLLVACGAGALAWFGTTSALPNRSQTAPEPNAAST